MSDENSGVIGFEVTAGETSATEGKDSHVLDVRNVTQTYVSRGRRRTTSVFAVDNVSLTVSAGEIVGLVGESGSGKSSLARAIMQEPPPTSGRVLLGGKDVTGLSSRSMLRAQAVAQMVFQDPHASLNPRWTVEAIVREPLDVQRVGTRIERRHRVEAALGRVNLDPERFAKRRPRQLSGGQAQRVAIARALVLDPTLLICDEVVSALDVSIQAQILNLFVRLRADRSLACLFIAHDLAVVRQISDRIGVMYFGSLVEIGPSEDVYLEPAHPYTDGLIASIPVADPLIDLSAGRPHLEGEPPSPKNPPSGCPFRTRCPRAQDRCATDKPELRRVSPHRFAACHFPLVGDAAPGKSPQELTHVGPQGSTGAHS